MTVEPHTLHYLLHHACACAGGAEYVLREAPFFSVYDEGSRRLPFLGSGYYFWDDNLDMAHKWGRTHYKNSYFVLEARCKISSDLILDLVGTRKDLRFLSQILDQFKKSGYARGGWSISQIIEFMKRLSAEFDQGIFPFQAIRAIDHSAREAAHERIKFCNDPERGQYMLLNPRILVCFPEGKRAFLDGIQLVA